MSRVILFDIDNTLLYTGGAGGYAMNIAFNELFGIPDGFARVEFSGRTDRWILQTGLDEHKIPGGLERHMQPFCERYYGLLPDALHTRQGYLMPGFPQLLAALRDAGATLGLATGNLSEGARIKLEYYGLTDYFRGGGFGDSSTERADVVADAIRAVANGAQQSEVVVIGDTPHDVQSALDNGAIGVGVATGKYTLDELQASGAHQVYADFSDWEGAAKKLLNAPA